MKKTLIALAGMACSCQQSPPPLKNQSSIESGLKNVFALQIRIIKYPKLEVLFINKTATPKAILDDSNSWGLESHSVELRNPQNSLLITGHLLQKFTRNTPRFQTILPGQSYCMDVWMDSPDWRFDRPLGDKLSGWSIRWVYHHTSPSQEVGYEPHAVKHKLFSNWITIK
jgi:hypothetical protein